MSNVAKNKSGGSYVKDPITGKRTLVEQTKQVKVTRLNEKKATEKPVKKSASNKGDKK